MLRHPYRLAGVATFPGPQHIGFTAQVMHEGRAIARVVDEGNAGPMVWQFLGDSTDDADALDRYAENLPMEADETCSFDEWCKDAFALRLFEDHRTMATLRALAPTRMVLLVPHIQKGMVPIVLPFPYDPSVCSLLRRKYGPETVILNERWSASARSGPRRQDTAGSGRVISHASTDARTVAPSASPLVRRDVRLRAPDVSNNGGRLPGQSRPQVPGRL